MAGWLVDWILRARARALLRTGDWLAGWLLDWVNSFILCRWLAADSPTASSSFTHSPVHTRVAPPALRDRIVAAGQAGGAEALRQEFESLAKVGSKDGSHIRSGWGVPVPPSTHLGSPYDAACFCFA